MPTDDRRRARPGAPGARSPDASGRGTRIFVITFALVEAIVITWALLAGRIRAVQRPSYEHPRLLLGDRHAAEDALQETLFLVSRKLPALRDPRWFRAWCYRIATREAGRRARLDGLSHAEIAEALELPVGTVKSRLAYALAALRRTLGATGPAAPGAPSAALTVSATPPGTSPTARSSPRPPSRSP